MPSPGIHDRDVMFAVRRWAGKCRRGKVCGHCQKQCLWQGQEGEGGCRAGRSGRCRRFPTRCAGREPPDCDHGVTDQMLVPPSMVSSAPLT
jgi:hypothetical protein